MTDVFISYQRQERDAVAIVAEKLRALKFDVWFDEALRAGGSFDQEIADHLKAAKVVLVCWTPAAIASEWVRSEAAMAHNEGKLLACFLEPTDLVPPFNLVHAEDLMTWAGQDDNEGWLGLLARVGELTARPGVASYHRSIRPQATAAELRAWAQANGADPLAENVWERIKLIEGENASQKIAREKAEARTQDLKRAEAAARSKALAKARGLRDPKEQGRRMMRITAAVVTVGALAGAGIFYSIYYGDRMRQLDASNEPYQIADFVRKNSWSPVHDKGVDKFYAMAVKAETDAREQDTYDAYVKFKDAYGGKDAIAPSFGRVIQHEIDRTSKIRAMQRLMTRLRYYNGPLNGKVDQGTFDAISTFQYNTGLAVDGAMSDQLIADLNAALAKRLATDFTEVPPGKVGPPTDDDFRNGAAIMRVDAPTIQALWKTEASRGFEQDGTMMVLFEPTVFSRTTKHQYDASHPTLSSPTFSTLSYPRTQKARWNQFDAAARLDKDAAFASASFGAWQVLGSQYKRLGFATPQELVLALAESEGAQLRLFARYIAADPDMLAAVQRRDWTTFVRKYHGAAALSGGGEYPANLTAAYEQARAALLDKPTALEIAYENGDDGH